MKKVILFFATGTEECEALLVVDLLRRAGAAVTIAAVTQEDTTTVVGSHDITLLADTTANAVTYHDADMVVLPGGLPGTFHLAEHPAVIAAVKECIAQDKWVAAICAAPSILGGLGLLDGRKATAHTAFLDKLGGANVLDQEVVVDGNIITSYGLGGAIPFALCLIEKLYDKETAEGIQKAISYRHKISEF